MAANGDDLKHFYAERIGNTVVLTVGTASVKLSDPLPPGRYRIHTFNVAGGAALLWVRQGPLATLQDAIASAPLMPIDLTEDPRFKPTIMVRAPGQGQVSATTATDGLSFIADAGAVSVAITRISSDG